MTYTLSLPLVQDRLGYRSCSLGYNAKSEMKLPQCGAKQNSNPGALGCCSAFGETSERRVVTATRLSFRAPSSALPHCYSCATSRGVKFHEITER